MKASPVEAAVQRALSAAELCAPGRSVVAALSGGADSVALLDCLATLSRRHGFAVVAAHLDHRLRAESAAEAVFCSRVCDRLGVPLRTGTADVLSRARREHSGLEEAARRERYAFLRAVKAEVGAQAIAVAHTRDDQAETVLLRLLRGSGRTGLGAMRSRAGDIVRPLLGVSHRQVLAHLARHGADWIEDPSNADTRLLRNRVRHELLPYLESRFNPSLRRTLARAAAVMADEADLLEGMAQELLERIGRRRGAHLAIAREGLRSAPTALARLALRHAIASTGGLRGVGRTHVERLLALAVAPSSSGRHLPLPGARQAMVRFGELWIGPASTPWDPFERALSVPGRVELPDGSSLLAVESDGRAEANPGWAVVPLPRGPLVVRTRRPGDRVWSGQGTRSLKKLLLECRVPADCRASLPLVAAGGHVVWFPGLVAHPAAAAGADSLAERRFVALTVDRAAPAPGQP